MVELSVVRNATHAARAWAVSPQGVLVRVEVLVTVSCVLLATLVFLGSGRRTSRSAAFRFLVWMALMLCYPAVSYTIGLIQSGSFGNDLVVVWACFLIGCADGIFACSVDHSDKKQARTVLNQATQVLYVLLLLVSYLGFLERQLQILLLLLWVLNIAKLGLRLRSLLLATGQDRVLWEESWALSKYMEMEARLRGETWDWERGTNTSMESCKYVVTGQKKFQRGCMEYELEVPDDNLVTVDKVWRSHVLRTKDKLKELCLSFALFKLLRRRLSAKPPPNDEWRSVKKGHEFVSLLAGGDDHELMYRVIEVELAFLYDFFYAMYPSPKQSLLLETALFLASLSLSLATLLSPALQQAARTDGGVNRGLFDVWLARFVIVMFMILELYQYLSLVLSDWHKVKMVCRYVRIATYSLSVMERLLLRIMSATTLTRSYWSNSVGQYSLLHGCLDDERSWLARMPLHTWIKDQLSRIRTITRPDLPVAVKHAIYCLVRYRGVPLCSKLKHGETMLHRNGLLEDFGWSLSEYPYTILVWHIATTVCQHASSQEEDQQTEREVAITLSNYCAYLLFQSPELVSDLMTDQIYETRQLTEALQLVVRQFIRIQRCGSKNHMFSKLREFSMDISPYESWADKVGLAKVGGIELEILTDGIKLGNQISDKIPAGVRWKVLSEVWVELLLCVAPSDNAMVHVKYLATGGELITHIWALMTHAGIIEKQKRPVRQEPVYSFIEDV